MEQPCMTDTPVNSGVRLPNSSNRTVIVGRTGSGKSQAGAWILSMQNYDAMPWVIVDYKDDPDEIFNQIEKAEVINYETIPVKPGIYILKCLPGDEDYLEEWLWKVWSKGNIGVMVDEGTMFGKYSKSFNACLTQGRSKNVPVIVLSQRPVGLSPYVFSEASYWMVFDLTTKNDRKTIEERTVIPYDYQLKDYHSYWYDVSKKRLTMLAPVPDAPSILARFDKKIPKKRRIL